MDNTCFLVSIRQRICQSGVPINIDKTFTNIENNTTFTLLNGYTLTISKSSNSNIKFIFKNAILNLEFSFEVSDSTTTVFDLPIDSGTFRILIFATTRCCCSAC